MAAHQPASEGLAETYFDNKDRDAVSNVQRKSKTIEAFHRLPEEFTVNDIMRCFGLSIESAKVRVARLQKDHLAKKVGDFKENGTKKAKYQKTPNIMI